MTSYDWNPVLDSSLGSANVLTATSGLPGNDQQPISEFGQNLATARSPQNYLGLPGRDRLRVEAMTDETLGLLSWPADETYAQLHNATVKRSKDRLIYGAVRFPDIDDRVIPLRQ